MEGPESSSLKKVIYRLADVVFLPRDTINRREKALADFVLSRTLTEATSDHRKFIVSRILKTSITPSATTYVLMHDEPDIAIPLLEAPLRFTESDLVSVVHGGSEDHRLAISRRPSVPPQVSEELVRHAAASTLRHLLRNESASFSRSAFRHLVTRFIQEEEIRDPLLSRYDLPTDMALQAFWSADHDQRLKIATRYACSRRFLDSLLGVDDLENITEVTPYTKSVLSLLNRSGRPAMDELDRLLAMPAEEVFEEITHLLANMASIRTDTLAAIVFDSKRTAIAVLAKAMGVGRDRYQRLFELFAGAPQGSGEDYLALREQATILYDSIARDNADLMIRFWNFHFQQKE